jgi:hypothetical protein
MWNWRFLDKISTDFVNEKTNNQMELSALAKLSTILRQLLKNIIPVIPYYNYFCRNVLPGLSMSLSAPILFSFYENN